jgi:hypothetical protein
MRNQRPDGCQLLALKKRLREETDPGAILRLRQREVKILLELGQMPQALAAARLLPGDGTGLSILGDVLCRRGHWKEAEATFEAARRARLAEGHGVRASALARGPLFLLAEARKDWSRCMELADIPVLEARTRRLSGEAPAPSDSSGFPWETIALLERCHLGGDPRQLPEAALKWGKGEREWKWRLVFEGATIHSRRELPLNPWRRIVRAMSGVVLDPRWPGERKALKALMGFPKRT